MTITITIEPARIGDGWDLDIDAKSVIRDISRKTLLAVIQGYIDRRLDRLEVAAVHPPDAKIPW